LKRNNVLSNGAAFDSYAATGSATKYVLYLHGGGLIYGSKKDLPDALKQVFLTHGYTVLALDYLSAPNASVKEIVASLIETFHLLKKEVIYDHPFALCGRSAGGYLMLQLTKALIAEEIKPHFLVNFYGYTDLDFIKTQKSHLTQAISANEIQNIDQTSIIWDDPYLSRFLLYQYGVQKSLLPIYYGLPTTEDWTSYGITNEELINFPPCFSTTSSSDEEVPFRYSKKIGRTIPDSTFKPVYYLEHDFLKQTREPAVKQLLTQLSAWLENLSL
jgi:acetyl esterase/lipase